MRGKGRDDAQDSSAICISEYFSVTSSPNSICKSTMPTACMSLWRVYSKDDSFFTSLGSLGLSLACKHPSLRGVEGKNPPSVRDLRLFRERRGVGSTKGIGPVKVKQASRESHFAELDHLGLGAVSNSRGKVDGASIDPYMATSTTYPRKCERDIPR